MTFDSLRRQIDVLIDHALCEGVDAREAYQAVVDAGAAYNLKLQELDDTLDQLDMPQLVWPDTDEDECDE